MTQAAGKLNHRISLESLETSQDSAGDTVEDWIPQGDVWAEVAPVSAKEFVSSAAMQSKIVARITIRYRADVQATWRVKFRNRYYNIEGVLTDVVSGLEYMTLPCSQGAIADPPPNPEPWQESLPALRQFITDHYGEQNPHNTAVMSSPPTIATSLTADATLTVVNIIDGPSKLNKVRMLGGAPVWNGALAGIKGATVTVGNITGTAQQNACGWEVQTTSTRIEFRLFPQNTTRVNVLVSESGGPFLRAAASPTLLASSTAISYVKLTFGSSTTRRIRIEVARQDGDTAFPAALLSRISLPAGNDCSATPQERPIFCYYGDSITEGSFAGFHANGYANLASWTMGVECTQSALGGTGYVVMNGNPNATQRLDDTLLQSYSAVVVAMGINDIGQSSSQIRTNVTATVNGIRSRNPSAQIFVVGPWDAAAPADPSAGFLACNSAVREGVPNGVGATFINAQGVAYTKSDAVHPNAAGHAYLADWLAFNIKTIIGA